MLASGPTVIFHLNAPIRVDSGDGAGSQLSNEFLTRIYSSRTARWTTRPASATRVRTPLFTHARFLRSYSTSLDELATLVASYRVSVQKSHGVGETYQDLARLLREKDDLRPASSGLLSEGHLLAGIRVLLRSGDSKDIELSRAILLDMPVLFGIPLHLGLYEDVVRTLLKCGHENAALEWLNGMVRKSSPFAPSDQLWVELLDHLAEARLSSLVPHTLSLIREGRRVSGCSDSLSELASDVLRVISKDVPTIEDLSKVLAELKRDSLPQEASELLYVKEIYADRTDLSSHAALIHEYYLHLQLQRQNEKLADESLRNGPRAALRLFRSSADKGIQAQPSTLNVILGISSAVRDLRELEREMGVKGTSSTWSLLVRNALTEGGVEKAKAVYAEARASNIPLERGTMDALIHAICIGAKPLQLPNDDAIDTALQILEDSVRSEPGQSVEAGIFTILLRTLLVSPNRTKYLAVAINLIEDMRKLNVSVSGPTLSAIIIMLLRVATSFDRAFALYLFVKNLWPEASLSSEEYDGILRAYCRAPCSQTSPLQPDQYFQIVGDMRRAKHPVTEGVYSLAFSQISSVDGARRHEDVLLAVHRIHRFLMVEPSFTPSTALWNQLMGTYIAVGSFTEAYRIWDRLLLSGRYDNSSLHIIVKACKSAGDISLPRKLYSRVHKFGFDLDLVNWNHWLECLCSADMLDEAVRLLCLEMPSLPENNAPDVRSARIVLACAKKNKKHLKTLSIIKQHLPELWKTLPDTLKIRN
ncbi:hypothetical protein NEOLEDRAFT_1166176 [Neolentinus lepideus HHB14362 ss-1]|uniref:Pentacotripeptide-repeat region of PRORP domain-containing protein n=1 Tax=Neolentinus lepideus HHB14362 ss-1 TaxID=1314782 RepID=A0A165W8C4_9AGAM|nr:hypothetical protein NEOLEDRAFT_1166176 [Neolentinus lepideus HHB14362 ss-1]